MQLEMSNSFSLVNEVQRVSTSLDIDLKRIERFFFAKQAEKTSSESRKLKEIVSEIREKMILLENLARRNTRFTPSSSIDDLCIADHMSAAFYLAVNGHEIDWNSAEKVLERFISLTYSMMYESNDIGPSQDSYEEARQFMIDVWGNNNFESNVIKLLQAADCWKLKKFLELIFVGLDM
jgi:hypothetical protein